jgi:Uma2 family endonuclease
MTHRITDTSAAAERRLPMSYEAFLAWADEDIHAEWVDGEVIIFMPPVYRHQAIISFLCQLLGLFVEADDLGVVLIAPFEMRARPGGSAREPDLLFVARAHLDRLTPERLVGPADLVVEVISESSVGRDREEKFREYAAAGVPEYWLFDPRPGQQRADFFRLTEAGTYEPARADAEGRYHAAVVPGFWLDPNWLWQEPLPKVAPLLAAMRPGVERGAHG